MTDFLIETERLEKFSGEARIRLLHAEFFYHGTQESRLERIKAEGIKPNEETEEENFSISLSNSVYVTTDEDEAKWFARTRRDTKIIVKPNGTFDSVFEKAFILKIPRKVILENLDTVREDENLRFGSGTSFRIENVTITEFEIEEVKEE
jgi:hypothetical protein